MLGLADYGSGSEGSDTEMRTAKPQKTQTKPQTKRAPKKIAIQLPLLPPSQEDDSDDFLDDRPTKRMRSGVGKSSLLSMLPAPKQAGAKTVPTQRILGSGSGPGLVFNNSRSSEEVHGVFSGSIKFNPSPPREIDNNVDEIETVPTPPTLLPHSFLKRKPNISLEEGSSSLEATKPTALTKPPVDFFSLGSASTVASYSQSKLSRTSSAMPAMTTTSAAPSLTEFDPPEPTPTDPYPGYYQLLSGAWAAYQPEYYARFAKKWQEEYDAHVRALEKGAVKGFEGLETATVEDVDAVKEMEMAKRDLQQREEKKALTKGAGGGPIAPKMNVNASKLSGIARSRHQLSTLLKEAYENREALEEKIAEGRRNRKEAGNKYGF